MTTPPSVPSQAVTPAFLPGFAALMAWWLAGELLVSVSGLPLPGPVAGMLLLLTASLLRKRLNRSVSAACSGILSHLSLLFIPAAVGIIDQADLLYRYGPRMFATLLLSGAITVAATGLTLKVLLSKTRENPGEQSQADVPSAGENVVGKEPEV